jgi:hypothetical protein
MSSRLNMIDGSDMVGIDPMAEAETVGQWRIAKQDRLVVERPPAPEFRRQDQRRLGPHRAGDLSPQVAGTAIENARNGVPHAANSDVPLIGNPDYP